MAFNQMHVSQLLLVEVDEMFGVAVERLY